MNNENLPIELKNNQLAVNRRTNKRRIEGLKRVGKIALSAGVSISGLAIIAMGGPVVATVAGYGLYIGGAVNAGMDMIYQKISKDSMFVQKKQANGEIKISQSVKDFKSFQKMKGFNKSEKLAMMELELLVELQSIKQQFEDNGAILEQSQKGGNVYSQVYSTRTHSGNIYTLEALEKLGYLQIQRKEPKGTSNLFFEKLGFAQGREEVKKILLAASKNELEKVQMYDIALRVTDKQIDFKEIYKSYTKLRGTREKSEKTSSIKRLGVVLEALRNKNIDIVKNNIGETVIDYNAEESFARRMKREQANPSAEYRKASYIGDTIEQGPVEQQQAEPAKEPVQEIGQDSQVEL